MVVVMRSDATEKDIENVARHLEKYGIDPLVVKGAEQATIQMRGDEKKVPQDEIEELPGVEKVIFISKPYKFASREYMPEGRKINISKNITIGKDFLIMAGPCAVESRDMILKTAEHVKKNGAHILRGGAFKPRTQPGMFEGLGEEALKYLAEARDLHGLPVVTEIMDAADIALFEKYDVDIYQVGARNAKNYRLLDALSRINKPVLLKRGEQMNYADWLLSAERILYGGNENVILCERGTATAATNGYTRNMLDLEAIAVIRKNSSLPIIIDPSHAVGSSELIPTACYMAATGLADGIIVEVHPNPSEALCDGKQSLSFAQFEKMAKNAMSIYNYAKNIVEK